MKLTRFQVLCKDGVWRFVFCRSLDGRDQHTGSQIMTTESRQRAYASAYPQRDLEYFLSHANGAQIREEIPMP